MSLPTYWNVAAQTLGLLMHAEPRWSAPHPDNNLRMRLPDAISLRGVLDGVSVFFNETQSATWDGMLSGQAFLPIPLDFGLQLHPTRFMEKIARLLGVSDVKLGDAPFDDAYEVRGDDPERVRALMTAPVRATIARLGTDDFDLDDRRVRLDARLESQDMLIETVRSSVALVRSLIQSAADVAPAADVRAHVDTWRDAAAVRGHAFTSSPLTFSGETSGLRFQAAMTRVEQSTFAIDLALAIGTSIPADLDDEGRGMVLALRGMGEVRINGGLLGVRLPLTNDPRAFLPVVEQVERLARRFSGRAESVYR